MLTGNLQGQSIAGGFGCDGIIAVNRNLVMIYPRQGILGCIQNLRSGGIHTNKLQTDDRFAVKNDIRNGRRSRISSDLIMRCLAPANRISEPDMQIMYPVFQGREGLCLKKPLRDRRSGIRDLVQYRRNASYVSREGPIGKELGRYIVPFG